MSAPCPEHPATRTSPGTPAAPAPPPRLPWTALSVLAAAAFTTVTAELLPASLLLEIGADLGAAPSATGLLVAAWALTVAGASLPLVRLTRRVPRRTLLPLLLVVLALATAGTALAPGYGAALAGRIVAAAAHGLFWSLLVPTAAAMVPPQRLGRAVSVVLAGPTLAGVIGIPAGTALGAALGWRTSFAVIAALLLVAAAAVRALPVPAAVAGPEGAGPAGAGPAGAGPGGAGPGARGGPREVVGVAVAGGLVLAGHFLLYTYVAPLLAELGGFDASSRAGLLLVFGLAGLVGVAVAGPVSDRFPRSAFAGVGVAFTGATAALALLGAGVVVAVTVVALWGVLIGLLPPVFQTRLLRAAPAGSEATAGAVGVTVLNLGVAVGAVLGGVVVATAGPGLLPLVAAIVVAIPAIALCLRHT